MAKLKQIQADRFRQSVKMTDQKEKQRVLIRKFLAERQRIKQELDNLQI